MTLKVAFYGAGAPAQPYLKALARRPDVQVIAVCDQDRRAAEQTAAGWGAAVHVDYRSMLQGTRPDALWICVAPPFLGDVIVQAAELHIPFFVEPPGAQDFEQARRLVREVRQRKLVSAVGFSGRYADVIQEAREYLGANPIPLALVWWLSSPELIDITSAERLLWHDACRFMDVLRVFCGEVTRVRALPTDPKVSTGALVTQLEFASGTVGLFTCATFSRPEPRLEMELLGEGWSLSFGENLAHLRLLERDKTTVLRRLNDPAADMTEAFLTAVMNGDPGAVAPSYEDALHTLAICQAAAQSSREQRAVTVAEVTDSASRSTEEGAGETESEQ